jgi:putative methyltransferase (TIGR04325 family)
VTHSDEVQRRPMHAGDKMPRNPPATTMKGNATSSMLGRAIIKVGERVPLLRPALGGAYARYFNEAGGLVRIFRGIYPDFAAAARDMPPHRLRGYDNDESAARALEDRLRIFPFDYPVLFWLARCLPGCKLLFDWGGNVGVTYYAYRRYLDYPPDLRWLVSDLPAVIAMGRRLQEQEPAPGLAFTSTAEELGRAEVLLAAGSLHFMEDPFAGLCAAGTLPRHVLLNKVPAYEKPSAVTLHNMGTAFCPYHLFNRAEFVSRFEGLGYRLVDQWKSPDLGCHIPFFPEHSIPAYSGFYFSRA